MIYDLIAQKEFGMDYDQLGPNEKEWVRDELVWQPKLNLYYKTTNWRR